MGDRLKPDNYSPALNAALDLSRSKSELMLENILLRQQLIIVQRETKRPKLTWRDRAQSVGHSQAQRSIIH